MDIVEAVEVLHPVEDPLHDERAVLVGETGLFLVLLLDDVGESAPSGVVNGQDDVIVEFPHLYI